MKRHGHLFEKVTSFENLLLAAQRAIRGKKDKRSVRLFYFHLETEIIGLKEEIESCRYKPRPFTQFQIHEPKPRNICSSEFRDRVVHHAICNLVEPIFEKRAVFDSYACRENKGAHLALARCQEFARRFPYYLKLDIKKYFESIDHEVLKALLARVFKDRRLMQLITLIIDHEVPGARPGKGLPIGNLTSQHFANFYLEKLDHFIKDELRIKGYVRYMDDFISFSSDKNELRDLLCVIENFVNDKLKLELKAKATTLAPVSEGVPFLGFRVFPNLIRIKRENLVRLRRKIRRKEDLFRRGKISEEELVLSVQSMVGHISHSDSLKERRNIFSKSLKLV